MTTYQPTNLQCNVENSKKSDKKLFLNPKMSYDVPRKTGPPFASACTLLYASFERKFINFHAQVVAGDNSAISVRGSRYGVSYPILSILIFIVTKYLLFHVNINVKLINSNYLSFFLLQLPHPLVKLDCHTKVLQNLRHL